MAHSEDEKRAHLARLTIGHFSGSEATREFINQWLEDRRPIAPIIGMFAANYRPGDSRRLINLVKEQCSQVGGTFYRSGATFRCYHSLMDVYEAAPHDASDVPLFVYEEASCAYARYKAVAAMRATETLPDAIFQECKHDSYEDTRRLVS